jgi:hypothetical protein
MKSCKWIFPAQVVLTGAMALLSLPGCLHESGGGSPADPAANTPEADRSRTSEKTAADISGSWRLEVLIPIGGDEGLCGSCSWGMSLQQRRDRVSGTIHDSECGSRVSGDIDGSTVLLLVTTDPGTRVSACVQTPVALSGVVQGDILAGDGGAWMARRQP